jgi:hypothetical protein
MATQEEISAWFETEFQKLDLRTLLFDVAKEVIDCDRYPTFLPVETKTCTALVLWRPQ